MYLKNIVKVANHNAQFLWVKLDSVRSRLTEEQGQTPQGLLLWRGGTVGVWVAVRGCIGLPCPESSRSLSFAFLHPVFQMTARRTEVSLTNNFCLSLLQKYLEPVYFYIYTLFGLQAIYVTALYVTSWLLSGTWLSGLLAALWYVANRWVAVRPSAFVDCEPELFSFQFRGISSATCARVGAFVFGLPGC